MKNLVLYFSVYGTARLVAEEIARQTGADILEIKPAVPYDGDSSHYNSLARYAKKEHDEVMRPAIKNIIPVENYDNIFIGYPMWWYTFPMIIYTLFDTYDFSGKTVIPFNTHMGSDDGGTYEQIKALEPNATVLDGFNIAGASGSDEIDSTVREWLDGLAY